jgi:hypothetical protein
MDILKKIGKLAINKTILMSFETPISSDVQPARVMPHVSSVHAKPRLLYRLLRISWYGEGKY